MPGIDFSAGVVTDDVSSRVLALLAEQGSELRYHGDFDWEGLRIANSLSLSIPLRWKTAPHSAESRRSTFTES